jgi:hypothetical protein
MSDLYFGSDLFEFDRLQSQTTSLLGAFRPVIGPATSGLFCRATSTQPASRSGSSPSLRESIRPRPDVPGDSAFLTVSGERKPELC